MVLVAPLKKSRHQQKPKYIENGYWNVISFQFSIWRIGNVWFGSISFLVITVIVAVFMVFVESFQLSVRWKYGLEAFFLVQKLQWLRLFQYFVIDSIMDLNEMGKKSGNGSGSGVEWSVQGLAWIVQTVVKRISTPFVLEIVWIYRRHVIHLQRTTHSN